MLDTEEMDSTKGRYTQWSISPSTGYEPFALTPMGVIHILMCWFGVAESSSKREAGVNQHSSTSVNRDMLLYTSWRSSLWFSLHSAFRSNIYVYSYIDWNRGRKQEDNLPDLPALSYYVHFSLLLVPGQRQKHTICTHKVHFLISWGATFLMSTRNVVLHC